MDQIHRKYELPHTSRRREEIEWSIHYAFNAGDRTLPRVLLVGDSICNGYHAQVRERLLGIANVTFWASSKCVTDPDYLRELEFILEEYPLDLIHFNNGLHSLTTDRAEWEAALRNTFRMILDKLPGIRLMWCASTPLTDPELTAQAVELNAIGARVAAEFNLPADDLFSVMNPLDRKEFWCDKYHFTPAAKELQGDAIAQALKPFLNTTGNADPEAFRRGTETGPDGSLR
ncbi:SGNH/GDSL hydrolase family protein [Victivallis vadensis]|uniref:SGNH/GDSL hydrolase family protein n=1 Tax=Victivallis vadensis TaxID=172901 RepID=A0A848AXX0_9BACT|nr:SGNH/GDSL hydrolase family protein [Victivallis vadensis]NMD86390.1 SGNH/GDSL hydrolase family protein [Victivallis vadensis]